MAGYICHVCKRTIEEWVQVCPYCGTRLKTEIVCKKCGYKGLRLSFIRGCCPECFYNEETGRKHCPKCFEPLPNIIFPKSIKQFIKGELNCPNCGEAINKEKSKKINNRDSKKDLYELIEAVKKGQLFTVKNLISRGSNIDFQDDLGNTPLHYAVERNFIKIVEFLVFKGSILNIRNSLGMTPLDIVKESGNKELMEFLKCRENFSIKFQDAVMNGRLKEVKNLWAKGLDVNQQDEFGVSALHIASSKGRKDIIDFLVEKGANIDIKDQNGRTPLHEAVLGNNKDIVKFLLSKGADSGIKDKNKATPVNIAKLKDYLDIYNLLEDRIQINIKLQKAAYNGDKTKVQMLLMKGANINCKNEEGYTPLFLAVLDNKIGTADFLISQGADINLKNKKGYTPLHMASRMGFKKIAKLLVSMGAYVNIDDSFGTKAIHDAVKGGDKELIEILVSGGADINAYDEKRKTPLQLAKENGYDEIIDFLLNKGAIQIQD